MTRSFDNLKKGYEKYQLEITDNGQNKKYLMNLKADE